ncbi:acetyl esterase/lipase [Kibdelosporangium banguiense]|uniref:Acetyl esterase/lipase n=1 Tax=Kibdelosporangium banguiense TaxID=1365924 RepID=A0ABS4TJB1_9PSEU|nr:alpha/beta hydrolase [Kibdelosporangium banguiense]MBP2324499.1 acetyl esterase/lipase [Kibdelosporangium banguiense]
MSYAIDAELLPWLDMLPATELSDQSTLDVSRARMREVVSMMPAYEPGRPLDIRDESVPGPQGAPDVKVRIYAPAERDGARPGLLYIHGGGFVVGDVDISDSATKSYADELGIVVVSVDYRLAPEHPYPAPVEDCFAALTWMANKASELGIDPSRIGVAGESAGGGLAAGVTLLARDRGGPELVFQYLGVPEIDDRLDTPSMREYVDTPVWNRPKAIFSWTSYLGDIEPGSPDVPIYAAPARATDLSGLPPTVVTACQFDPLRDEDITYAQRLMQAGIPVELRHYAGTFHGSGMITEAAVTKRMKADALEDLRRGLKL